MNCPSCKIRLSSFQYEGIEIESCSDCGGSWLDGNELGKIVKIREVRFDKDARRAIAESTTITPVEIADVDRDLSCPKCVGTTDAINYGGNTGIIIDRCTGCRGFWLDAGELEKIQMVVEGWEDQLPEDLAKYGPVLRDIAAKVDQEMDESAEISRMPVGAVFIDASINGILGLLFPF